MSTFEIPLTPAAQRFDVVLNNVDYFMQITWNRIAGVWQLDLYDGNGVLLAGSMPMLGDTDMLAQYGYLAIGGMLVCFTDGAVYADPTFDNLGVNSHLFFVTA